MSDYETFLQRKSQYGEDSGFEPGSLPSGLFDFQQYLVQWACRKGRGAIFSDCGTGKTAMQLAWADQVVRHTGKNVLILTPLAVSRQTVVEGQKFGIPVMRSQDGTAYQGITVANYERLSAFNSEDFVGCVADECFPPNTPIDVLSIDNVLESRYIQNIQPGDRIINAQGVDHVTQVYKRPIHRAVRLGISGREPITCSEHHPFFTVHGWRSAENLHPGDYLMETAEAMRVVRGDHQAKVSGDEVAAVLRQILLSEMAYGTTRNPSKGAYAGCRQTSRIEAFGVAPFWPSKGATRTRQNYRTQSHEQSREQGQGIIDLADDEAQTFRAWWQWDGFDHTAAVADGCTFRRLASGMVYLTGPTGTEFSNALHSGYRESLAQASHRMRWPYSSGTEGSGPQEGYHSGFARVDSVEILELGHPDLDQWRDATGQLYFYDLKAARHPSYSIGGLLVHNSSILKSFDGVTRNAITNFMRHLPYRLLCTATAAPNDYIELGTSSEAIGELGHIDMLNRFFRNQSGNSSTKRMRFQEKQWRFKGHAQEPFWQWVCSWARACRSPADLGFSDERFHLPTLTEHRTIVEARQLAAGMLFSLPAIGLDEQREEMARTVHERCEAAAELVNARTDQAIIWCQRNSEGDLLEQLIPDAVQIAGADEDSVKEHRWHAFIDGRARVLITKPKIGAWGINLQNCAHVIYFPSHSYEQYYQAIRRCWRFGQMKPVTVDLVMTEGFLSVMENLHAKALAATEMFQALVAHMHDVLVLDRTFLPPTPMEIPAWLSSTNASPTSTPSTTEIVSNY